MPYFDVGKGFLMKASEKRSESSPDYTGKIEIDLESLNEMVDDDGNVQLSAWLSESKSGKKYLSLKLSVHEEDRAVTTAPSRSRSRTRPAKESTPDLDDWKNDDVPF
jgi:hypothetical protein